MKLLLSLGLAFFATSCFTFRPAPVPVSLENEFADFNGCFLLFNMKTARWEKSFGGEFCKKAQTACSTFKIPLALIAFDTHLLKGPDSKLVWDRKAQLIPTWNKDQTARTWIRDSVVWFSQDLTLALGEERITRYLKDFEYGDENFTGGLKDAWLTKAPFLPEVKGNDNKLKISPYQQIEFMAKLYARSSPFNVSNSALEKTRRTIRIEESPEGFIISGKTGSGFADDAFQRRMGWYVVHGEGHGEEYLAVVFIEDKKDQAPGGFGSQVARRIMNETLAGYGLY